MPYFAIVSWNRPDVIQFFNGELIYWVLLYVVLIFLALFLKMFLFVQVSSKTPRLKHRKYTCISICAVFYDATPKFMREQLLSTYNRANLKAWRLKSIGTCCQLNYANSVDKLSIIFHSCSIIRKQCKNALSKWTMRSARRR